ncbi:hypothetical protein BD309DRAFT_599141 [Dichomitus squalens]|nr:hypothetical protein BD309DRAFT_599141 [Dichomitus squalens]
MSSQFRIHDAGIASFLLHPFIASCKSFTDPVRPLWFDSDRDVESVTSPVLHHLRSLIARLGLTIPSACRCRAATASAPLVLPAPCVILLRCLVMHQLYLLRSMQELSSTIIARLQLPVSEYLINIPNLSIFH